jgi:hypothetical protein
VVFDSPGFSGCLIRKSACTIALLLFSTTINTTKENHRNVEGDIESIKDEAVEALKNAGIGAYVKSLSARLI